MHIVAVPGRMVRDPSTRRPVDDTPLLIDELDLYWARLLRDGDVVEATEDQIKAAEEPPAEAGAPLAAPTAPSQEPRA